MYSNATPETLQWNMDNLLGCGGQSVVLKYLTGSEGQCAVKVTPSNSDVPMKPLEQSMNFGLNLEVPDNDLGYKNSGFPPELNVTELDHSNIIKIIRHTFATIDNALFHLTGNFHLNPISYHKIYHSDGHIRCNIRRLTT